MIIPTPTFTVLPSCNFEMPPRVIADRFQYYLMYISFLAQENMGQKTVQSFLLVRTRQPS
jgi:hypothetical protein